MSNHIVAKYNYLNESKIPDMVRSGNWIIFRKYNGRQALWDGEKTRGMVLKDIPFACPTDNKRIVSTGLWSIGRDGFPHVIYAPNSWLDRKMPIDVPLCGELWLKNDDLFGCTSIVAKKNPTNWECKEWNNIQYIPFNIKPYHMWPIKIDSTVCHKFCSSYAGYTFKDTLAYLYTNIWRVEEYPQIMAPEYKKLTCLEDWEEIKIRAKDLSWEGMVLVNLYAKYEMGLTSNILKYKFEFDVEAKIIGYSQGAEGKRNDGLIGALLVETVWPDNVGSMIGGKSSYSGTKVVYKVSGGLNDDDRLGSTRITKGKIINVKFNSITNHAKPSLGRIDWETTEIGDQ